MQQAVSRYLSACEARGLAERTLINHRYHLSDFARVVDKPPADVTAEDVEDYFLGCAHLARSTRRARHEELHAFFGWLHARGRVRGNPLDAVPAVRPVRQRPTYYEPMQAAAVLAAAREPRTRLLLCLLLRHGQRISSVLRLTWSDVDLEHARVRYPSHKGGAPLTLALDLDTARQLRAWRALVGGELVFPGRGGVPVSYTQARTLLRNVCRDAGVPWRGAHEFRRTCVTTLLQMGEPLHVVSQRVAGHADVATTVKFYAGVDDEDVGAAIRRLPY